MPMPAPLTPGDDPRLGDLLRCLPDLGVPVGALDHERVCRVLPPGRMLGWEATRELLVTLLAKDEEQRRAVRGEFRRLLPPLPARTPPGETAPVSDGTAAGDFDAPDPDGEAPAPPADRAAPPPRTLLTPPPRRWPWWRLALATTLGLVLILTAAFLIQTWRTVPLPPPRQAPVPPPPAIAPTPIGELPAQPLATFNDWVPVFEARTPAERLGPWLAPLALLCGGLLALAWLWERARRLLEPAWSPVPVYDKDGEPVFAWTPEHLHPPGLLTARARRELVWGVQRFAGERATTHLDIPATVHASAASGLPQPRFAPARYEREVWLWLDTRLRSREAVALADQIERDLVRAGLRVRRGTFVGWPDRVRLATGERTSPLDLGPAARTALVCLFTEGADLARALDGGAGEDGAALQRVLRELGTWPRLCLVDLAPPDLDLPALAARLRFDCCPPAALPAWLAERPDRPRGPPAEGPAPAALALRLWAAACALPRLPVTSAQARALYETLGETLGLPSAWRLPNPGRGHASPDGIRFSDGERQALLRDLARWAAEDGWGTAVGIESQACRCLALGLAFWERHIGGGAASLARISARSGQGPADQAQTIERLLLVLWRGDAYSALAVRALYDLYQQEALQAPIRERLGGLDTWRDGAGPRIELPWTWNTLPEAPAARTGAETAETVLALFAADPRSAAAAPPCRATDQAAADTAPPEPRGTARQRLYRMGFAGAAPGARPRLGAETLILLGTCAGLALAGGLGLIERLGARPGPAFVHAAPVYDDALFQALVMEGRQDGRPYAASRKHAVTAAAGLGADPRLHWCWSGLEAERAAPPCRALAENPADPRRVNPLPMGRSALLRAGTSAEPIRACAKGWPQLSVAVIVGDPWNWPPDPPNNESARRLAIRLLDRGSADLVLIGPDWAEQARVLAGKWSFAAVPGIDGGRSAQRTLRGDPAPLGAALPTNGPAAPVGSAARTSDLTQGTRPEPSPNAAPDSQWLFFAPPGTARIEQQVPPLGTHRALLTGDLEAMARALDFPGARPAADALSRTARVTNLAGNPRLWGGPEVEPGPKGIAFVQVCPGTFTMGSAPVKPDTTPKHLKPHGDERLAHPVVLDGFWIGRTETSQTQYAAVAGDPAPAGLSLPEADINWTDARKYCQGLAPDADLPTEAQWEYAARAGTQDPYPFPDDLAGLCTYANGAGNETPWQNKNTACSDPFKEAAPIGRFPPNPLGLYDMHGNLWEWVRDCWDDKAYAGRGSHPLAAPVKDSGTCAWRVLRGGSFGDVPQHLRSAVRDWSVPQRRDQGNGFRCVRGSGRQPAP
jgi:formylglycine-generating enzyme required for sulfatase activity